MSFHEEEPDRRQLGFEALIWRGCGPGMEEECGQTIRRIGCTWQGQSPNCSWWSNHIWMCTCSWKGQTVKMDSKDPAANTRYGAVPKTVKKAWSSRLDSTKLPYTYRYTVHNIEKDYTVQAVYSIHGTEKSLSLVKLRHSAQGWWMEQLTLTSTSTSSYEWVTYHCPTWSRNLPKEGVWTWNANIRQWCSK